MLSESPLTDGLKGIYCTDCPNRQSVNIKILFNGSLCGGAGGGKLEEESIIRLVKFSPLSPDRGFDFGNEHSCKGNSY